MSADFLKNFMQVTEKITEADRFMAIDRDGNIIDTINLTADLINSPDFADVANISIGKCFETGKFLITNNIITDPSEAPKTNTQFSDLRVVVVIPVGDMGAIYLDQPIRYGVIPRETVENLVKLVDNVQSNDQYDMSTEAMESLYELLE